MIRVAILGASGYSALELIKLLAAPSAKWKSPRSRRVKPSRGRSAKCIRRSPAGWTCDWKISRRARWRSGPIACSAACRTGRARRRSSELLPRGKKVIDLSADYRLNDAAEYRKWYGARASRPGAPGRTRSTACRKSIATRSRTRRSSPTPAAIQHRRSSPSRRCLEAGAIKRDGIIVDSKSGVSGAGREPKPHLHFPECNESVSAYGVGTHRHMPEIDQVLSDVAGGERARRLHAASDADGPRHPHHVLRPADRRVRRQVAAGDRAANFTPTSRSSACRRRCLARSKSPARISATSRSAASAAGSSSSARSTTSSKARPAPPCRIST